MTNKNKDNILNKGSQQITPTSAFSMELGRAKQSNFWGPTHSIDRRPTGFGAISSIFLNHPPRQHHPAPKSDDFMEKQ
ncbi:hypothetical protein EMIT0111MI5_30221 [Burkholderia sp. IT-111MI5]